MNTTKITVVTGVRLDPDASEIQIQTREVEVAAAGSPSEWRPVVGFDDCADAEK